jgi:hypothetical protein
VCVVEEGVEVVAGPEPKREREIGSQRKYAAQSEAAQNECKVYAVGKDMRAPKGGGGSRSSTLGGSKEGAVRRS